MDSGSTDHFCSRLLILKNLLLPSEGGLDLIEEPLADFLLDSLRGCQDPTDEMYKLRDSLYSPLLQVTAQGPIV